MDELLNEENLNDQKKQLQVKEVMQEEYVHGMKNFKTQKAFAKRMIAKKKK